MNNEKYSLKQHLDDWSTFLVENITIAKDNGTKTKYERQLKSLLDFYYGANPNINLNFLIKALYEEEAINIKQELNDNIPNKLEFEQKNYSVAEDDNVILKALNAKNLFLIQGPPGTGKTTTISEIILQLFKNNENENRNAEKYLDKDLKKAPRILILAETHIAVDNIFIKLANLNNRLLDNKRIIRYPNFSKTTNSSEIEHFSFENHILSLFDEMKDYLQSISNNDNVIKSFMSDFKNTITKDSYTHIENDDMYDDENYNVIDNDEELEHSQNELLKNLDNLFMKYYCMSADILGMSCNHLGRFRIEEYESFFDVVIIDEVSKATLPEILLGANFGKKLILVGDPKQLPPVFCQDEIEIMEEFLDNNLLKHSLIDKIFEQAPSELKSFLPTQYRMPKDVGNMVSDLFYNKRLQNGKGIHEGKSLFFFDYDVEERVPKSEKPNEKKLENHQECYIIMELLAELEKTIQSHENIAIITPYTAQQKLLIKNIKHNNKVFNDIFKNKIEISTIDAYQGREAEFVVISLVRNSGSPRFFKDLRRLNVAMSRVKKELRIVGNSDYLRKHIPDILEYFN